MKIALYGNVCNNMYSIAKALRLHSDYDVHLYLPENADFSNLPENDEPDLKNNYPFWMHKSKEYNLQNIFNFWQVNIIKELNKYDLVILSSLNVALSPFLKRSKTIFFVTGGDLTVLPFKEIHRTLLYNGRKGNIKPLVYQWTQRQGIEKVDKIITQSFYPFVCAAEKLKISESKIIQSYFPIIFDTQLFQLRQDAYSRLEKSIQEKMDRFSFRIFHPSRIVMNNHPHLVETGQWKQNDLIVRAFAKFVKENNVKDAGIYFVDRSYGLDKGIVELKELINYLEIDDFVIWLKPENPKGFTRDELVNIYSLSNIVTDDYGAGWFGSICVEGFSCSKPVISYVDENAMQKMYSWHPFLSSNTVDGNAKFISKIYFNKEYADIQGDMGRKWALEFHSQERAGKLYVKEFRKIIKIS